MRLQRAIAAAGLALALLIAVPSPGAAVHLFPVTPNADPLGHDCAKALTARPATASAASVRVAGFSFLDGASNSSTTTVTAGQSVTWTWALDHCHSVTFTDGRGTRGAPGFMPANQEQLIRLNGAANDSFTMAFPTAGTFAYTCVHHAAVGMTGTVVVRAAPAPTPAQQPPSAAPPPSAPPAPAPSAGAAPPGGALPATGGHVGVGVAAAALGLWLASRRLKRRSVLCRTRSAAHR